MAASTLPVTDTPTGTGTVLSRQARAALAAAPVKERLRCFVVGPAGSGKTTLLHLCAQALREAGRKVRVLTPEVEPGSVPADHTLFVDDLTSFDADRLAAVLARAADPASALVVAMRPWPRPDLATDIARCLDREEAPVVLGQVARSDVLAHLHDSGAELAEPCLSHILTLTGGVTWLVAHALANHDPRDCAHDPDHTALDHAVEAQVAHRLDTVPDPLRRAVEHLVVAPGDARGTLLASAATSELIELGHAEGLLLRNGDTVPVVRAAVRSALPLHRLHDLSTPASGADLLVRQGLAAWASGDLAAAAVALDALGPDAAPTDPDVAAGLAAAVWAAQGMMGTASDVFAALPPACGSPAATHATLAHIGAGRADRLPGLEPDPDAEADTTPNTVGVAFHLLERGLRASLAAEPPAQALTDLVRGADLHPTACLDEPLAELPGVVAATVALGSGQVATAEQVVDAALAAASGGGWARRRLLLWQAWLAMNAERPADARASLAAAERLPGPVWARDALLLESVRIGMARRYDTLAALETAWRDGLERIRHIDVDLYTALPLTTLVTAAARVGDSVTLAAQFDHLLAILQQLGSPPAWATHVWWAGVQQGILLNEPEMLAPHARALVAAAPRNPLAAVMARAGGVWVAVLGGSVDPDAVEVAARELSAAGLAWDGARLAGHASRRATDRRVVTRMLALARELHPRETAARAEEGRDGASGAPGNGVLSQREWDVATLVLEGKTYNEIGATIFISPKTVEHHVAHIRRRIGATSRSDLMAKLRVLIEEERDAPP